MLKYNNIRYGCVINKVFISAKTLIFLFLGHRNLKIPHRRDVNKVIIFGVLSLIVI